MGRHTHAKKLKTPLPNASIDCSLPFFTQKTAEGVEENPIFVPDKLDNRPMEELQLIKEMLWKNQVEEAIRQLDDLLLKDFPDKDEAYYLRANAWRRKNNWKNALDDYQRAADLNPQSPAVHARRALLDILEFYNKDMYNQ